MKSSTLALFVIAIAFSVAEDDFEQKVTQASNDCISQTGVDKKLADDLEKKDILVDDPKLKEFVLCLHTKIGYQNENGDPQPDVIREGLSKQYSEEQVNKIIEKCLDKKDTPLETSYYGLKCALEIIGDKH